MIETNSTAFPTLCTPLLPFEEISPDSTTRQALRARLASFVARPEVLEALWVATSSSLKDIEIWNRAPDGPEKRRAEASLVFEWIRLTSCPTPEGPSAGFSTGTLGEETRLRLSERASYRRRIRLEVDDLDALAHALSRSSPLRNTLRYFPSSSLHRTETRILYFESRFEQGLRLYPLVAVDREEALELLLDRARQGALRSDLARALIAAETEGDLPSEEAEEFVDELIDAGLLVPRLSPAVTGEDLLGELVSELRKHPSTTAVAERLASIGGALADLETRPLGVDPENHRAILRDFRAAWPPEATPPVGVDRLHVDWVKPAQVSLGPEVLAELRRGLGWLDRLPRPPIKRLLSDFAARFRARYGEGAEVPLLEALDEESGIGLPTGPELAQRLGEQGPSGQPLPDWLPSKVEEASTSGATEIRLSEPDLDAAPPLADPEGPVPPLPAAFHLRFRLAAASPEALAAGDFRLWLRGLAGPSGARLLGRLCSADETLCSQVEQHLRAEEALDPEAVFAEIVHLPEGRSRNAVLRPRLRQHEIPFLSRGAAEAEHRIDLDDLRVRVEGETIQLRSARLGRRVVPRLTAAHFFGASRQTPYRFLASLQDQSVRGWGWNWSWLDASPFLPRVSCGRLVFTLARWQIPSEEIHRLAREEGRRRDQAVQRWRTERRLPRWVVWDGPMGEIPIDLDNPLVTDAFLTEVGEPEGAILLTELFPAPDELCVQGPEGRFVGEIILPWIRS